MRRRKSQVRLIVINVFLFILASTSAAEEIRLNSSTNEGNNQQTYQQIYPKKSGIKVGIRFMGGMTYMKLSDVNNYFQGMNDYFDHHPHISLSTEFEPIDLGKDFRGEVFINFNPSIGLGIGAGYTSAGRGRTVTVFDGMGSFKDITLRPEFSAVPITFTLYYGISLGSKVIVQLDGGVGYYLGSVEWERIEQGSDISIIEKSWSAESNEWGFHGGIDFEFEYTSHFSFVFGAKGRLVKLKNLTGGLKKKEYIPWSGTNSWTEEHVTLWYGIRNDSETGGEYPWLLLEQEKPVLADFRDVREAVVDLTGITLQAGFKVTF